MFKIYDGRDTFYQWDTNQKLIIENDDINEVHFCNRTDECSLVCEVYSEDSLRVVNVPDVLLQTDWTIRVYGYNTDHTEFNQNFKVIARSKPEDYIYTPEEIKTWEELNERIDEIETNGVSDEMVGKAVENYLTNNPITSDVTSVNGKQGAVELTAADVGALPADTIIPSTTGLATEKYVDDKVAAVPQPDLSGYATKNDISGLATTNYVDEKVSNVKVDLTGYATESFVSEEIAKAQLAGGDVDLSGYYTKSETDTAISNAVAAVPQPDLTDYAKKSEIPDVSGFATTGYVDAAIAAVPTVDLTGYATEDYVDEAIANIPTSGGSVAVDGKTIIENADGTISTAIGGYIQPAEELFTWEGSATTGDAIALDISVFEDTFVDMDGDAIMITYTLDGEEYEEEFDISTDGKKEVVFENGEKGSLTTITVSITDETMTVEHEGTELTAISIMSEESYEGFNHRFINCGSGLKGSTNKIQLDTAYVEDLIATYLEENLPSAEGVSY